ncbi:MAG: SAM-dependent DNA methyltransferase [Lentisphaeria bacterium]|nr:SAM-dependent DNA methyltransferase [Lentisphaeria bacterium]
MSKRISIEELQSYLWNSAVLLRTSIDAGAYKQYIFPLLFFKRICDVYDEECVQILEEFNGDTDALEWEENHRFIVPQGAHWKDVRSVSENIGKAIVEAFRQIEKANSSKLQGIFGDGAWTNKNRLPDRLLKDLIEHFSTKTLSIANCPEDELGQGYEYLIKKFADDSGHTAQEFYTNRTVVHLMTEMLSPESGESIYDPTCGSAGMLISAIAYLKASKKEWRNVSVYGQEINALTSAIGKMNLFLHGVKDFYIVNGDTLKAPAFIEHGQLKTFDLILANPPYSISQWDREAFLNDKYGRNFWGVPPQGRADYAFFQHIVKSLDKKTGRCAILFPHGVLFRNEENDMREKLVKSDCLECVIGLGPNLFYNSPMEACIVICRMNKAHDRKGKVLFINAINEVERKNAQSYLTESHIKKIAQAYAKYESDDDIAKVATIQEIENNNFSLSIPLYVKEPLIDNTEADDRDLQERYSAWSKASKRMRESYELLNKMLEEGGNADA